MKIQKCLIMFASYGFHAPELSTLHCSNDEGIGEVGCTFFQAATWKRCRNCLRDNSSGIKLLLNQKIHRIFDLDQSYNKAIQYINAAMVSWHPQNRVQ